MKNFGLALSLMLCLVACESRCIVSSIQAELTETGQVDLAQIAPGGWDRVCILGPYSTDEEAALLVGAPWSLRGNSSAWESDGVSALLLVRGQTVLSSVDVSRAHADFSGQSDKCFPREKARFVRLPGSKELVPAAGLPALPRSRTNH
ncbi:hypothetical protein [Xanthomonas pisi]|uniref:hypothetical protein n=1 Tax=Xanthomonas pisi TaxID=56457 RepID=UPI0011B0A3D3|nr:hypothetical protein [Xanthomonas pisi]